MTSAYDADPVFQANPLHLDYLLHEIHNGALTIPDFQRDFTWEPKRAAGLLRSMMSRFPAGTFLFWAVGEENKSFGWRPVQGSPSKTTKPKELILDGQQRLTALYRALNGIGDERYFLSLRHFVELPSAANPAGRLLDQQDIEFESGVFWHSVESKEAKALATREARITAHVIAIDEHRDFDDWLDDYASSHSESMDEKATKSLLRNFRERFLTPLRSYGFPVVTLPSSTSIEAVATVFETLNSTGKPLGPFELLTARFYPQGVKLRDLWEQAQTEHDILKEFAVDEYSLLQSVTLRAHNSAQRSDVLRKLTGSDVTSHWPAVSRGFAKSIEFLQRECGVVSPKLVPYTMLLVPMAAIWDEVSKVKGPKQMKIFERLKQFFWCSVFSSSYDQGANSQAGADYARLRYWLFDSTKDAPEAVKAFSLLDATVANATTRRKALYAGILALTASCGAKDFHTGSILNAERVRSDKIDSHHLFPKDYLNGKKNSSGQAFNSELALNRTLIDPVTNKVIGSRAPSVYLGSLTSTVGKAALASLLATHLIDGTGLKAMRADNYDLFLESRLGAVITEIERVTGKVVTREATG